MRMSDGSEANVSSLDGEGNSTFLEDFEVFTFRDAINVAAYTVMSAGVSFIEDMFDAHKRRRVPQKS